MRFVRTCLVAAAVLWMGCEHADPLTPGEGGGEPTLSRIQAEVFTPTCATSNCHTGSNAPHGLDLSAGAARASLVNVASRERPDLLRVAPGDPDNSYLVKKLRGDPDIVGGRMPLGGERLPQAQIDLVVEWIRAGALAN